MPASTKIEYMTFTKVAKGAIWFEGLPKELGIKQEVPLIHYDYHNFGKASRVHGRSKHIDIRYHKIRFILRANSTTVDF